MRTYSPKRLLAATILVGSVLGPAGYADDSKVPEAPTEVQPALIGAQAPSATVRTLDGKSTELKELLMGKKSVLIFYRGGW